MRAPILLDRRTCVEFGPRSGRKRHPKNRWPKPRMPCHGNREADTRSGFHTFRSLGWPRDLRRLRGHFRFWYAHDGLRQIGGSLELRPDIHGSTSPESNFVTVTARISSPVALTWTTLTPNSAAGLKSSSVTRLSSSTRVLSPGNPIGKPNTGLSVRMREFAPNLNERSISSATLRSGRISDTRCSNSRSSSPGPFCHNANARHAIGAIMVKGSGSVPITGTVTSSRIEISDNELLLGSTSSFSQPQNIINLGIRCLRLHDW